MKKTIFNNEKGFVLLVAIIASLIILALGVLVISMSTGDLRGSAVTVGDKKALAATESGIYTLVQDFNPDPVTWTAANHYTLDMTSAASYIWRPVDAATDVNTEFAVGKPTVSNLPPVEMAGYSLETWAMMLYNATIAGQSKSYKSVTNVDIGIGYGPVPMD